MSTWILSWLLGFACIRWYAAYRKNIRYRQMIHDLLKIKNDVRQLQTRPLVLKTKSIAIQRGQNQFKTSIN